MFIHRKVYKKDVIKGKQLFFLQFPSLLHGKMGKMLIGDYRFKQRTSSLSISNELKLKVGFRFHRNIEGKKRLNSFAVDIANLGL